MQPVRQGVLREAEHDPQAFLDEGYDLGGEDARRQRNRSVEMERIPSLSTNERIGRPPSGGAMGTSNGLPRSRRVTGITIAKPEGPSFMRPAETTTAGRSPPCSWPPTGSKATCQTSPRRGRGSGLPVDA